eukprot:c12294_g2_i1.p1 GENE.c12294_g2_i1~~c12294_g2_i1.p1  ORF type:complete len:777 (-),score=233.49 c12294_g2_i1:135-2465(-)
MKRFLRKSSRVPAVNKFGPAAVVQNEHPTASLLPIDHTTNTIDSVLTKTKHHLTLSNSTATNKKHTTQKSVAREIVAFLNSEYDLSSAVQIDDFAIQNNKPSEVSKARSQLAIATQRAAAFFALQANLFRASLEDLNKHTEIAKKSNPGYDNDYFEATFVVPLFEQAKELQDKFELADLQRQNAQNRFRILREQATEPIMEQLQVSSKAYGHVFREMNVNDMVKFCWQVEEMKRSMPPRETSELRQTLQLHGSVQPDSHTLEYLQTLYGDAKVGKEQLHKILGHVKRMCGQENKEQVSGGVAGVEVEVEMGGLKAVERAMEKTVEEYEGDFSRLLDLARGSIVCKDIGDAVQVIEVLTHMANKSQTNNDNDNNPNNDEKWPNFDIVRVKNRLDPMFGAAIESGGYRDILMNVKLESGHVCEVQVQIEGFLKLKAGGGHKIYSVARSLHLLDAELSQVRAASLVASEAVSDETLVRDELRQALQRVAGGTCQGLHLNNFKLTSAECVALRQALLSPACNVHEIYLAGCGLDETKSALLCEAIGGGELGDFSVVDLFNNKGLGGACSGMFVSDSLKRIFVRDCTMDAEHARQLSDRMIATRAYQVTEMDIKNNHIGPDGARYLAEALSHTRNLSSLNIEWNELGVVGAQHLASALTNMHNLLTLNLSGNEFRAAGAQHLACGLTASHNITSLDLADNMLKSAGAQHLSAALVHMHNMTALNLGGNEFGATGAESIGSVLSHMPNITSLNLWQNRFKEAGAEHLAGALIHLQHVTFLTL